MSKITLATLKNATAQEVFDQVSVHMIKQGIASMEYGICRYHLGNLSCAAGCLIAESEYKKEFEHRNWWSLTGAGAVPSDHSDLIQALQQVHDTKVPEDWRKALHEVAEDFNLFTRKMDSTKGAI